MGQADEVEDEARPGRSRILVAAAIGGGLVVLAGGAAWLERTPIAAHFVDRELAARGVPGSYRITAIGPFAQRLEDVRLGDPAHPDLVAKSLDLTLGWGLTGPYLAGIRADGVRLAAKVANGTVSLGALDKLMPASSDGPLRLPDLAVTLADTRVALATPAGALDAALSGQGNLSNGFRGHIAAASPRLTLAGCTLDRPGAQVDVVIADRKPHLTGPLDLAALVCGNGVALAAGRATLDLAFAATLDRWQGAVALAGFPGRAPGASFGPLGGSVSVAGDARRIEGDVKLTAADVAARGLAARQALANGHYRYAAASGLVYAGDIGLGHAALSAAQRSAITEQTAALSSTPIGPLILKGSAAVTTLLADADATATVALTLGGPHGAAARLRRLLLTGRSGGRVEIDEGAGFGWNLAEKGWRADGRLTTGGGGLPALDLVLHQAWAGAPVQGVARLDSYAAGGARLALTPIRFESAGGNTHFDTVATVDGTSGGVRVDGLVLPLVGRFGTKGMAVGETCMPIAVHRLAIAGMVIENGHIRSCGVEGAAIVSLTPDGYFGVGMEVRDAQVAGHSGTSPLTLALGHIKAAPWGFKAENVAVRLGPDAAQTRFDMGSFNGSWLGGFQGDFADASGQIARVPLVMSGVAGDWSIEDGALLVDGGLSVADAATPARFLPMTGKDVKLKLAGGTIAATATLTEPKSGAKVADVALTHDLSRGTGGATLTVPGLAFASKGLQPEALTPLTLGIVANLVGTVTGKGDIAWGPAGVTSTGDFATERIDLAAAFGPVTGISGKIHFSDLLGMVTPPGQEAIVAEVNPGIAVTAGVAHYQLLPGNRIQVEDARWPFAGGDLTLDRSTLEFGQDSERHLTFRVKGLDAGAFINQLALPNVDATGLFDGTLPMIFDSKGGRIQGGEIAARPPGGTLAYVGQLSNEQIGAMGKLAFDALKAIRYRSLSIGLDGRLDGEIVSRVKFDGIRQATPDAGYLARLIHNLPFRFNITVRAPFRSLLGTAESYIDPSLLLQGGLPQPGTTENLPPAPIQPAESEPVR